MLRPLCAVLLLTVGLGACQTIAPNQLSVLETASLRFTSLEVRVPETASIAWSTAEDDYLKSRGLSDSAAVKSAEGQAYLRERAGSHLKAALERVTAEHQTGTRPVKVVATLIRADIPSAAQRVLIGGRPMVKADVAIYDARTNALLTSYTGANGSKYAGQGVGGVLVDAALVANGADDLYDRAAKDYADGFGAWLNESQPQAAPALTVAQASPR